MALSATYDMATVFELSMNLWSRLFDEIEVSRACAGFHQLSMPAVDYVLCREESYKSLRRKWLWLGVRAGTVRSDMSIFSVGGALGIVGIPKGFPRAGGRVESRFDGFPCFPLLVISNALHCRNERAGVTHG